ncbi:hypothetical protein CLV55_1033 [Flavobacterium aciduliphilum]|uniref:Uncharacterized protein n=1 Tax=Flavobacterium aciduliphilum TaxID=1101402 RepID=A0A328YLI7_9FLAO|nr:hypothetical protein CLV55_1033 [Flavobacterium aciduliphilum]
MSFWEKYLLISKDFISNLFFLCNFIQTFISMISRYRTSRKEKRMTRIAILVLVVFFILVFWILYLLLFDENMQTNMY